MNLQFCNAPDSPKDTRPHGNEFNKKVRMSNALATNAAVLIGLVLKHRPKTYLVVEQPKGSWLWKLPIWKDLILKYTLGFVLTYFGLWGMDILKGSHLCTNLKPVDSLARKATKQAKQRFQARVNRKFALMRQLGKKPPVYYTVGVSKKTGKKNFTGGKGLQKTALYPIRFCNALFQVWLRAYQAAIVIQLD